MIKNFYTTLASTGNEWEKHSKSQSLQPKQKKPTNFFCMHTICVSHTVTDQISFNNKFGKPDLTQCGMNELAVI